MTSNLHGRIILILTYCLPVLSKCNRAGIANILHTKRHLEADAPITTLKLQYIQIKVLLVFF